MSEQPIDALRLIAALRENDQATIEAAYRQVFAGPVGRLVLAHMLREAGVGAVRPRDMGGKARVFMDGAAFAAIGAASMAGFDQASVVLATFTGEMEGPTDDRRANPRAHADPGSDADPGSGAEPFAGAY